MMFFCIILWCSLLRFQQVQDCRKRSSWAKVMAALVFCLDLARSLRSHRSLRPLVFRCQVPLLWCGSVVCPEVHRRWSGVSGHNGVSGPKDPESPVPCFSCSFDPSVVRLYCPSGSCPEAGRNLRPGPESPAHLYRSLRSEWPPMASFSGDL